MKFKPDDRVSITPKGKAYIKAAQSGCQSPFPEDETYGDDIYLTCFKIVIFGGLTGFVSILIAIYWTYHQAINWLITHP